MSIGVSLARSHVVGGALSFQAASLGTLTQGCLVAGAEGRELLAVGGRFELREQIGQGGMATVFLARDLESDRPVAVKLLRPEFAQSIGPGRFLREIRLLAAFDHPNILPLIASGEDGGQAWFAVPFVTGGTLRERLVRDGPLPLFEAAEIVTKVAAALDHAHRHDVVHRDIKPENILLDGDTVWVADFGIARLLQAKDGVTPTSDGKSWGTPMYMSPEQSRGGPEISARSDVYSLACVAYELVTGSAPFAGANRDAVMARHALDPVPPARTVRKTLTEDTDLVLAKALEKVPADRYPTAGEFAAAFSASIRAGSRLRRRRQVGAIVGSLGVVAAGFVLATLEPPDREVGHRVVVVPFAVVGDSARLGEDLAIALVNALNSTDTLIAELPAGLGAVADGASNRLRRQLSAGFLLRGTVDVIDSIRVTATVVSPSGRHRVQVAAPKGTSPYRLGTLVARQALPDLLAPTVRLDAAALGSDKLEALSAYLAGERAYRRGRFDSADSLFGQAVEQDTTFTWAALRGAQAASWLGDHARATRLLTLVLRRSDSLGQRYQLLARGLAAYQTGAADVAVGFLRTALSLDPRWAEARMALGDVYHHYLPSAGYLRDVAAAQFDSALALDPGFAAPLFHAIQHAFYLRNRPRFDSLVAMLRNAGQGAELDQVELMAACLAGRLTVERWREAARRSVNTAAQAATWMAVGGLAEPRCVAEGLGAVAMADSVAGAWRPYLLVEGAMVAAARGDAVAAGATLDSLGEGLLGSMARLFLASAGPGFDDSAADSAASRLSGAGVEVSVDAVWAVGAWMIQRGRLDEGSARANALERTPGDRGDLLARSLRARLALARADTQTARRLLREIKPTATQQTLRWTPWASFPWERATSARLEESGGDRDRADRLWESFDSPASFGLLPWLPASLVARERSALRRGDQGYARLLRQRRERLESSRVRGQ
ncbi:MAG: hypothetical protein FJ206_17325 [Gemmatimonadetes bacterium]|nr:hypothetical protein [Gemmatimonadota bacterium]